MKGRDRATESFDRYRRTGEPGALADVFDLTANELLRLALHLVGDPTDAEDCLQATYLTAMEKAKVWNARRPLAPWLAGILRNHTRRTLSRRRTAPLPEGDVVCAPVSSPGRRAAARELSEEVEQGIQALGEPYRRALLLRLRHGLAPAEIADVLGVPAPTVRSWIRRGLAKLRPLLPVGLTASGVLALAAERGLAGVRAAVLAQVPVTAPLAGSAAAVGGVLVAKKLIVVAAVLAILATGSAVFLTVGPGDSPPDGPERDSWTRRGHLTEETDSSDAESAVADDWPPPVDLAAADRERDLHGIVVTGDGAPAPGVEIAVKFDRWRPPHVSVPLDATDGPSTRSAVDGSFLLRLSPRAPARLRVTARGRTFTIQCVQAGERLRIVLPDRTTLRVTVRDEAGEPVAGAGVVVSTRSGELRMGLRGTTGPDGSISFDGAPVGQPLQVNADDGRRVSAWALLAALRAGEGGEVDLVLRTGRTLTGRVIDAATGAAVSGVRVHSASNPSRDGRTDEMGAFTLDGWLGSGDSELRATADGYLRAVEVVGDREVVEIALGRGAEVAGRIVDERGRPVPGAGVSAQAIGTGHRLTRARTVAGDDGRFRLAPLTPDLGCTLVASAGGRGRVTYDLGPPAGDGETRDIGDIVLPAARAIEGRVLGPDGKPTARVLVSLSGGNADRDRYRGNASPSIPVVWSEARRSDDLGRFRFDGLAPGNYTLGASLDDAGRQAVVDLTAERDVTDLAIDFGEVAGREIVGVVVDEDGGPVPGVRIFARTTGGSVDGRTDETGRARLRITAGTAVVSAHGGKFLVHGSPIRLDPNEPEARFTAVRLAWVSGRFLTEGDQPVPRGMIWVIQDRSVITGGSTDEEGVFRIPVPARGPSDLVFWSTDDEFARASAVPPGTRDLLVRAGEAPRDASLRVRVVDPDERAMTGVRVWWQESGRAVSAKFGTGGVATLDGLVPAPGHLMVPVGDGPEHLFPPAPMWLLPAGQEVVLRFRRAVLIRGMVERPDGGPVGGTQVLASDPLGQEADGWGRADAAGRFTLRLPETVTGRVRVRAVLRAPDGETMSGVPQDVEVGRYDVRILLGPDPAGGDAGGR